MRRRNRTIHGKYSIRFPDFKEKTNKTGQICVLIELAEQKTLVDIVTDCIHSTQEVNLIKPRSRVTSIDITFKALYVRA